MIIVSQDNKVILNFNNIQSIRIERYTTHEKGKFIYKIFGGNFEGYATEIGTYETEERAVEVLNEIIGKMQSKSTVEMTVEGVNTVVSDGIYRMPKE